MPRVDDALYNSSYSTTINRRECTAETREEIFKDIRGWAKNATGAKVYWMNGMAGTGKTTIAYSLCKWLEETGQLGANFFCSNLSTSCSEVKNIVPSLVYQLAHYSPAFRLEVCKVLEKEPQASRLNAEEQLKKLVLGPMEEVKAAIPENTVVVIDALDECEEGEAFRLFLETLLRLAADLPIRLFLTSRPEPAIMAKMMLALARSLRFVLHLHDIEKSIVELDIKRYLTEALGSMSPPPERNDIEQLAKRAGNLFIYAATAVRYILPVNQRVNSRNRLRTVLGMFVPPGPTKQHDELNQLYTNILSVAINTERLEEHEVGDIQRILRAVVCAKEPISAQAVASLLRLPEDQVCSSLQSLQSVLHVQEGVQGLVSPFHASFLDYLLDKTRSGDFHFDIKEQNKVLANRCFDLMERELKFNICQLESSFVLDKDVVGLKDRIKKYISPGLSYACRYWGDHLLGQGTSTATVPSGLVDFLTHRLLFWMEVLNLKQWITFGIEVLHQVQTWLKVGNLRLLTVQTFKLTSSKRVLVMLMCKNK